MEITRKAEKKVTQKEDSAIITVVETNEKTTECVNMIENCANMIENTKTINQRKQ